MDRAAGERDLACSPIPSSYSPYTIKGAKLGYVAHFNMFVPADKYPGCQRLFMRGSGFESSKK